MSEQLNLTGETPAVRLTPRQQFALDYLAAHKDGSSPTEVGYAYLEARENYGDAYCHKWAQPTGSGILRALRRKGLAIQRRKRENLWFALGHEAPEAVCGAVPGDLPEGF